MTDAALRLPLHWPRALDATAPQLPGMVLFSWSDSCRHGNVGAHAALAWRVHQNQSVRGPKKAHRGKSSRRLSWLNSRWLAHSFCRSSRRSAFRSAPRNLSCTSRSRPRSWSNPEAPRAGNTAEIAGQAAGPALAPPGPAAFGPAAQSCRYRHARAPDFETLWPSCERDVMLTPWQAQWRPACPCQRQARPGASLADNTNRSLSCQRQASSLPWALPSSLQPAPVPHHRPSLSPCPLRSLSSSRPARCAETRIPGQGWGSSAVPMRAAAGRRGRIC